MILRKSRLPLREIHQTIDIILQKIDKENEDYFSALPLEESQKILLYKATNSLEKKLQAFFLWQKREYLARIKKCSEQTKKQKIKWKYPVKKSSLSEEQMEHFVSILTGFLFVNETAELDRLAALYVAFTDSFFGEFATICATAVENSEVKPNQKISKKATDWLTQHKIAFAKEVNQTTHDAIIQSLKESLSEGKGMLVTGNKLVVDVPEHFNQKKLEQKAKKLSELVDATSYHAMYQSVEQQQCFEFYRARRIARTETLSAMNAATLEGWRQSQVVGGKEWICACDKRSRRWHKEANGKQVSLEEPFLVGGEKLMHPGDSSLGASAKNVIQCRCTMKSVLKYQMRR